jgi:DEAD/DEAH box helicase domain-containing protein
MQMHTTSFWLTLPEPLITGFMGHQGATRPEVIDGLRGAGHALETLTTLCLMCDGRDLGQTLGDGADETAASAGRDPHAGRTGGFNPTLFLFDAHAGGVGLAERIYERAAELVGRAAELVRSCSCKSGCPACVGPSEEHAGRKQLALKLLDRVSASASDRSP